MNTNLLDQALQYAARGWPVFPLKPNTKEPATNNGFKAATTEEARIRAMFQDSHNLGIPTGPVSGFWMLGPDGQAGLDDLEALAIENCEVLPPTYTVRSPSGGCHYYFRWPSDGQSISNRANFRGTKIDVRGEGGYVVASPSVVDGKTYEVIDAREPVDAPAWLLEWVRSTARTDTTPQPARVSLADSSDNYERARKYLSKCPGAVAGQGGHNQTYSVARAIVWGFDLPQAQALDLLLSEYNPRCTPPWTEKELEHKVKDANEKPFDKPRGWLLQNSLNRGVSHIHAVAQTLPPPTPAPAKAWPKPMAPEAFIGPIGRYVQAVLPETEAAPEAILVQALVAFGCMAGRSAYMPVGADRHYCNTNAVIVGNTSGGRKGTSASVALFPFRGIDEFWERSRMLKGLSSGEGLIHNVRDANEDKDPPDRGVDDKRTLIQEPEFVQVLKQGTRTGNTLSVVIREAFDTGTLATLTKTTPATATGAHISILGHITEMELMKNLTGVESANGFANRFLWVASKRSKHLPDAPVIEPEKYAKHNEAIRDAVNFARGRGKTIRDTDAQNLWRERYEDLEEDRPGLAGAISARGAAHVIRLSLIYALSDSSGQIKREHLQAALAVWDYSLQSVAYIFGGTTGHALADECYQCLLNKPGGVTKTDLHAYLGGHTNASKLNLALTELQRAGLIRVEQTQTGGRAAERWYSIQP